jgi:hypothetical protein
MAADIYMCLHLCKESSKTRGYKSSIIYREKNNFFIGIHTYSVSKSSGKKNKTTPIPCGPDADTKKKVKYGLIQLAISNRHNAQKVNKNFSLE